MCPHLTVLEILKYYGQLRSSQKELRVEPGRRVVFDLDLILPQDAAGASLRADIHIAHFVRDRVTAGIFFSDRK